MRLGTGRRGTHASTDLHSIASSPHPAGGSAFARAPVAFTRCLPDAGSTTCCASWTSMAWSWAATSRAATLSAPRLSSSRGKTSPDPCSWSHRGINNCAWGAQPGTSRANEKPHHTHTHTDTHTHTCGRAYTFVARDVPSHTKRPLSLRGAVQPPRSLLAERPMEVQRRHEGRHRTQYWDDAARTGGA